MQDFDKLCDKLCEYVDGLSTRNFYEDKAQYLVNSFNSYYESDLDDLNAKDLEIVEVRPGVIAIKVDDNLDEDLLEQLEDYFESDLWSVKLIEDDDLVKLNEPTLFFQNNKDKVICFDEIQLQPELFSYLRSEIDRDRRNGRFILLGSASRNIIQHTSESLAGRIGLIDLTPFVIDEIHDLENYSLSKFWLRGGYPDSYKASSDEVSALWRENFIRTYVERDIPQFGFQITAMQMLRLLIMCAHNQGQILNASKLGEALGVTHPTIKSHIDILEQTYILRTLRPYFSNTKKRLVKSPRIYVRDSGVLHQLLRITDFNSLLSNPVFGSSWEGLVVENICSSFRNVDFSFYRSSAGDEMDLVLQYGDKTIAIECKSSTAPQVTKGFWNAIDDIKPDYTYIVAPIEGEYDIKNNVTVCGLFEVIEKLKVVL